MKRNTLVLTTAVTAMLAATALAAPLKVKTSGGKSQSITMCPDCKEKITCATAGDYLVGLDVDLENAKTGTTTVAVHLQDKAKKPVTDAQVVALLSMPHHKGHELAPLTLKHTSHGRYVGRSNLSMTGAWKADVEVTPASGDRIKQVFIVTR